VAIKNTFISFTFSFSQDDVTMASQFKKVNFSY